MQAGWVVVLAKVRKRKINGESGRGKSECMRGIGRSGGKIEPKLLLEGVEDAGGDSTVVDSQPAGAETWRDRCRK
jgi:hypothetical protein